MSKEWYVLHTYSGYENKVKENIEMRTESMNMQDHIFRIAVPEEEVVEKTDGVEKKKVEKTFPGYVLVEMEMSDEAWFIAVALSTLKSQLSLIQVFLIGTLSVCPSTMNSKSGLLFTTLATLPSTSRARGVTL